MESEWSSKSRETTRLLPWNSIITEM